MFNKFIQGSKCVPRYVIQSTSVHAKKTHATADAGGGGSKDIKPYIKLNFFTVSKMTFSLVFFLIHELIVTFSYFQLKFCHMDATLYDVRFNTNILILRGISVP